MEDKIIDFVIKVAACVCGKDGVISQSEEQAILTTITLGYPNYSLKKI